MSEADVAALAREAKTVEGEINQGAAPGAGEGAQPGAAAGGEEARRGEFVPDPVRMIEGALLGTGRLLAVRCPSVGKIYTTERCHATALCVSGALDAMGWDVRNSKFVAVATGLGALLILSLDTASAVHADLSPGGARSRGGAGDSLNV